MSCVPFERIFAMSAFEAVRMIRQYRAKFAELRIDEIVAIIRNVESDSSAHDYEAGTCLDSLIPTGANAVDSTTFYRFCIETTVHRNTVWTKLILRGRTTFIDKLERDQAQCFRAARLLDTPSEISIRGWWERIWAAARAQADDERLRRSREAELLSLAYEQRRLKSLGILLQPDWTAFEDNTAGYDVKSYSPGAIAPINKLIEVKSTIASPIRFFVTRNEWDTAVKFGSNYFFHIWDLQERRLYELTIDQVRPHIPTDNDRGRWSNVLVPLGSSTITYVDKSS